MHAYLNTYLATYHGADLLWAVANLGQTCRGVSCPLSFSSSPLPLHCFIPKMEDELRGVSLDLGEVVGGGLNPPLALP